MRYTRLGDSGLIVSRLGFGTLSFGKGKAEPAGLYKVDDAQAGRLVGTAIDAGVTYFNTADAYAEGHSERMLGRALGARRKDVVLCTKVGLPNGPALIDRGLSRRHILASVDASLQRLNTGWIDVLVLHCTDTGTPLEETLEALQALIAGGKARYVGVSNWPAWLTAKAVARQHARGWPQLCAAEVYYSLVGRDIEHEVVPMARDAGIGLQCWSPLAGGLLTGRASLYELRNGAEPLSNYGFLPVRREQALALLEAMAEIAREHGGSVSQVAIAWLLTRPSVASVIVGASSEAQLADNLGASELVLSPKALERLEALTAPEMIYPGWYAKTFADPQLDVLDGRPA